MQARARLDFWMDDRIQNNPSNMEPKQTGTMVMREVQLWHIFPQHTLQNQDQIYAISFQEVIILNNDQHQY